MAQLMSAQHIIRDRTYLNQPAGLTYHVDPTPHPTDYGPGSGRSASRGRTHSSFPPPGKGAFVLCCRPHRLRDPTREVHTTGPHPTLLRSMGQGSQTTLASGANGHRCQLEPGPAARLPSASNRSSAIRHRRRVVLRGTASGSRGAPRRSPRRHGFRRLSRKRTGSWFGRD